MCCLLFAVSCLMVDVCRCLLFRRSLAFLLFVVYCCCSLFVICRVECVVVCCLLRTVCWFVFVVCCVLFVVCCWRFIVDD